MSIDFQALSKAPRVLIEAHLKPVAGTRIQPTGFPDLGAALYDDPNDIPTLLVESAQSMANRLEAVCWDETTEDISSELKGLPYIKVNLSGLGSGSDTTCSLLEFHRLNSPYISQKPKDPDRSTMPDGKWFRDVLIEELGMATAMKKVSGKGKKKSDDADTDTTDDENNAFEGVVNLRNLARVCFKYDPNSLIHGVFLEKIAGRLRHPRSLSAFIEANGVGRADSGGVKLDRANPSGDTSTGKGNVPFHRTEFTAKNITAFFSLDLAQIRGYGLGDNATQLLIALSLWKVRRFLESSMRLRTACELELKEGDASINAKRPDGFALPATDDLSKLIGELIGKCRAQFADPAVTTLTWKN